MSDLNILKGSVADLPVGDDINDGALYFCTDSLEIYEGYIDTNVEPNEKKLRRYNGSKILVETSEGTSVLDSCITEGQYTYIIRGATQCTLMVNAYTVHIADDNTDVVVVQQNLFVPVDVTEIFNQPGIYIRHAIVSDNGNTITWEDFRRTITDFEIAPPSGIRGQFLMSEKDYGSKWVDGSLVPVFKDIVAKSKLVTENGQLKWEEDNGSKLPVIQETEGTTVLDTCKTEGEYIYISPSGVRNRLIVNVQVIENYDDSGIPAYIYTQFMLNSIDLFADNPTHGVQYRVGIDFDGESIWEEFDKSLSSSEFEDLIPTPTEPGLIAISNEIDDKGRIVQWVRGKLLPSYSDSSKKLKLVAKDNEEYWEEDNSSEIPEIQETEGTTVLDTCTTDGIYNYLSPSGVRHKLIVSTYSAENVDGMGNSGSLTHQTIIATPDYFGSLSQRGIYQRYGTTYMGQTSWEDFEKFMSHDELENIIPEAISSGMVFLSAERKSNRGEWAHRIFVPQLPNHHDFLASKARLVAIKDADGFWNENHIQWEEDTIPEPDTGNEGAVLTIQDGKAVWKEDNGSKLPVIQETEGTTVLDTCITEGDYIYISPNGVRHKLIISAYNVDNIDGEGTPGTVINQTLIMTYDISGESENYGIYYRLGFYYMGEIGWEEFYKSLSSSEFEDLIPTPTETGLIAISDDIDDRGHMVRWVRGKLLPSYSDSSKKLKLVAKDNKEYWEEDTIPEPDTGNEGEVLTIQDGKAVWKEQQSNTVSFTITIGNSFWLTYGDTSDVPKRYIAPIFINTLPHNISNDDTIIVSSNDDEYSLYDIYCKDNIEDYNGLGDALIFIATSPDRSRPSTDITVKVVKL